MKEIGQQLKARREELNLSISEVSMSTKINARVIKAMEEGDMTNLPAKTFLRGFVRTYSNFLKLDTDSILEAFLKEMGTTKPQTHTQELSGEGSQENWINNIPILSSTNIYKKAGLISVLVVLTIISVAVKKVYDKYEQERAQNNQVENIQSIQQDETTADVVEDTKEPTQQVEASEDLPETPPSQPTAQKPETAVAEKKPVETQPTKPEVKKPEPPKKLAETSPAPKPPPPVAEVKKPEVPKPQPTNAVSNHEVIIEALDDVTMDYRVDGTGLKNKKLKADQTFVIRAGSELAIDFSDGGAINIIHNGVDKGVPGNLGIPKKVKFQ